LYIFLVCHACYITRPSHPPWLDAALLTTNQKLQKDLQPTRWRAQLISTCCTRYPVSKLYTISASLDVNNLLYFILLYFTSLCSANLVLVSCTVK
jgi:hypothetical protein